VTEHLVYLLLGLGTGAAIAMLGLGLVLTNRASRVVNFGHAAIGMWIAHVFYEFRETGDIAFPIPYFDARVALLPKPTVFTALVVIMVYAALMGLFIYVAIFRRLRSAPPLGRVVASIGLFLYLFATAAVRFPDPPRTRAILPAGSVEVFGRLLFVDRLFLAAIAIVLTLSLWAFYRYSRFGLATTAAAENEKGASLTGINPDRLAAINWMVAAMLAGLAIILVSRIDTLDPLNLSLLVVPALAAALLGGFNSFALVAVAGLAIGMLQGELVNIGSKFDFLSGLGIGDAVPFLLILVALFIRGRSLPTRGDENAHHMPLSPEPRWVPGFALAGIGIGVLVMRTAGSDWRSAVITSSIAMVISLSVVVLTGYVGQISLAPFAFAGVAAFSLVRLGDAGVPFPVAPIVAALISMVLGVIVGIPAIRVRGMNLAIATLGAAVAIEQLLFKWPWFVGDHNVPEPKVGGIDLSIAAKGSGYPRPAFGIYVVVVAVLCAVGVANLRRSRTGLGWLAVRANERAAAAAGVNVSRAKLMAFAVSAFLAGVAGTLTAYQRQTLSETSFAVFASLAALAITYLMGVAAVSGAFAAGLVAPLGVFILLRSGELPTEVSRYEFATSGLVLIVVAVAYPNGVTQAMRSGVQWIGRKVRPDQIDRSLTNA